MNPGDDGAVLVALKPYFSPDTDLTYLALKSENERQSYRDEIVLLRMRAYDLEFDKFERQLWASSTLTGAGSDLAVLILSGIGATSGDVSTKTALAAASAGIIGFQGAISKDIYFQRTLPALLSQIEANRDTVKLAIVEGLKQPDATYSLFQAEIDLQALQRASEVSGAVSNITQQALDNQAEAQTLLTNAKFGIAPVASDVQQRRVSMAESIRKIAAASDKAKLDKIADLIGVAVTPGEAVLRERNDILTRVLMAQTEAQVDDLAAKLNPILK